MHWIRRAASLATLQAPTSATDPCSVTLIQSVNNRIRHARNSKKLRRNIAGQAEVDYNSYQLAPKLGEKKVSFMGLLLLVAGLLMTGAAQTVGMFYLGLGFLAQVVRWQRLV